MSINDRFRSDLGQPIAAHFHDMVIRAQRLPIHHQQRRPVRDSGTRSHSSTDVETTADLAVFGAFMIGFKWLGIRDVQDTEFIIISQCAKRGWSSEVRRVGPVVSLSDTMTSRSCVSLSRTVCQYVTAVCPYVTADTGSHSALLTVPRRDQTRHWTQPDTYIHDIRPSQTHA